MNALVAFENQLKPLAPRFADVLPKNMPVERLMRTVVVSVERMPKLLECDRQSLFNSAMSAAVLGLEVDGVTGQAFLIPFKDKAQLVIGYKGYNTLAARAGMTITGAVVREGDRFDYDLGEGWVMHHPELNNKNPIKAAWAKAAAKDRPAVVVVMGIDDLTAVKQRSPGARRSDSPWNDPTIGFPAMCEKTVKRRLARSMPLNVMQFAARLDEAVDEEGKSAWISPERGVIVEGEVIEAAATPTAERLMNSATTAYTPASAPPNPSTTEAGDLSMFDLDKKLEQAAKLGWAELKKEWEALNDEQQTGLRAALNNRHKPAAREADKAKAAS